MYRDIAAYNEETADELAEETGWKLVHGDVFRPPQFMPMLLSVFVGSGNQLLLMTLVMLIFACLGFLSPANRGGKLKSSEGEAREWSIVVIVIVIFIS